MEQIECSEMSAYKIQKPGNYPEENIKHTEQGESLKSRILRFSPVSVIPVMFHAHLLTSSTLYDLTN
jgi:hypothetical protein